jgi:hypothetical protein
MAEFQPGPSDDGEVKYTKEDDHALLWSMVIVTDSPKSALLMPGRKLTVISSTLLDIEGIAAFAMAHFEVREGLAPNWNGSKAARVSYKTC